MPALATNHRPAPLRRQLLKAATDDLHEAMHARPELQALLDGRPSRAGYAAVLRAFYLFHARSLEIERAASAALGENGGDAHALSRIAAARADLTTLGMPVPAAEPAAASNTAAWNVGYSYVTRGSALGGKVLHRALESAPDWARSAGLFFAGSGGNGTAWPLFCVSLDGNAALEGCDGELAEGATAAFQDFRRILEECCS
ncbi:MAG TPA: biliverdin-producing heme oxygenase [Allosphingosinicella sp.]|jgi:heme oxygenase